MLKLKDIIGNPCMGRKGLGTNHFQQWGKADPRQRKDMIQFEVRHPEEEGQQKKLQTHMRPAPSIQFIREGKKPPSSKKTKKSLLQASQSWEKRVDLERKLHFPQAQPHQPSFTLSDIKALQ
ncbi:hypothetical protein DPX16_6701 [Anabarilius grahami]|uniref:Uncharacterized protein n=1 Tax=Anabarilius grahami TaxID=495550 RepID=A0A3N0YEV1_ANAGA|nr:hypothetical protein DPX16_6701 [Anabarilius grahami]